MKRIYLDLLRDLYAAPNIYNLEDFIAQYKNESSFVPSYEGFCDIYLGFITDEYLMANGRVIFVQISDDPDDLNEYALMLGLISEGENYTGTATDFANAFVAYANKHSELFVPDHDTYQELWFGNDGDSAASVFDARLSVSGTLLEGSQIGIITEGATYGRVVAVGSSQYPITNDDLSVFSSDDPAFRIVRHPTKDNQLILESRYTIRAIAGANGRISPQGNVIVISGQNWTFTITPASGYHISDVTVDGISQGAISTYTFENVTADHTIEATFAKDSSGGSSGTHNDYTLRYETNGGDRLSNESKSYSWDKPYEKLPVPVRDGYVFEGWYYDSKLTNAVEDDVDVNRTTVTLYAKWSKDMVDPDNNGVSDWLNTTEHNAYLSGYANGNFGPNDNMTRAQVAQMFYNLLMEKNVPITVSFTDVPADAWYATAVNTLASLGIVNGIGDGQFAPERTITRSEFTVIAMRFTNGDVSGNNTFSDVSVDDWFYDQVVGSIQYGWINGFSDGTFRPYKTITRAEVVTIVNRMLGRSADEDYVDHYMDQLRLFPDVAEDYWAYYQIVEATNAHDYRKDDSTESWLKLN